MRIGCYCPLGKFLIVFIFLMAATGVEAALPSLPPGAWSGKNDSSELLIEKGNRIRFRESLEGNPIVCSLHTTAIVRNEYWIDFDCDETPFNADRLVFVFHKGALELLIFKEGSAWRRIEFVPQKTRKQ